MTGAKRQGKDLATELKASEQGKSDWMAEYARSPFSLPRADTGDLAAQALSQRKA